MYYIEDFRTQAKTLVELIEESKYAIKTKADISEDIYKCFNELISMSKERNFEITRGLQREVINAVMSYPFLVAYVFICPVRYSELYNAIEYDILEELNSEEFNGSIVKYITTILYEYADNKFDVERYIKKDSILKLINKNNEDAHQILTYNDGFIDDKVENNYSINLLDEILTELVKIHPYVFKDLNTLFAPYYDSVYNDYMYDEYTTNEKIAYELFKELDRLLLDLCKEGEKVDVMDALITASDIIEEKLQEEVTDPSVNVEALVTDAFYYLLDTVFNINDYDCIINRVMNYYISFYEEYDFKDAVLEMYYNEYYNDVKFDVMRDVDFIQTFDVTMYIQRSMNKILLDFN